MGTRSVSGNRHYFISHCYDQFSKSRINLFFRAHASLPDDFPESFSVCEAFEQRSCHKPCRSKFPFKTFFIENRIDGRIFLAGHNHGFFPTNVKNLRPDYPTGVGCFPPSAMAEIQTPFWALPFTYCNSPKRS
jgi:hypothetical protein